MSRVYMLDTNISSAAIRGDSVVSDKLDALPQAAWCISAVTVAEHVYDVAKRPQATTLARLVRAFLLVAEVLPWGWAAAEQQGELRADLESKGTPIHEYDLLIAAHALSEQLILVTDNEKHFCRVPGLVIENWLK
jgi:tRNA(fMet)-specific endonuclease VapC